jgi:hypothetical protein
MAIVHDLRKLRIFYRIAATLGLLMYFLCEAWLLQALATPVPSDQQNFLAIDYRFQISRTADALEREALYLRLMDECPDTEIAEESYWALANLYLDDFDEPKEDKARESLELFMERYPASRWISHVESRLLWLRGGTGAAP